jgi:hypothetical protein
MLESIKKQNKSQKLKLRNKLDLKLLASIKKQNELQKLKMRNKLDLEMLEIMTKENEHRKLRLKSKLDFPVQIQQEKTFVCFYSNYKPAGLFKQV